VVPASRGRPSTGGARLCRAVALCAALLVFGLAGCRPFASKPKYERPAPKAVYVELAQLVREHPLLRRSRESAPPALVESLPPVEARTVEVGLDYTPESVSAPQASCPSQAAAEAEAKALEARFEKAIANWIATSQAITNCRLQEASYPWLSDLQRQGALAWQATLERLLRQHKPELVRLALVARLDEDPARRAEADAQLKAAFEQMKQEAAAAAQARMAEAAFTAQLMAQQSVSELEAQFAALESELLAESDLLKQHLQAQAAISGKTTRKLCQTFETKVTPRSEHLQRQVQVRTELPSASFEALKVPGLSTRRQALEETRQLVQILARAEGLVAYTDPDSRGKFPDATETFLKLVKGFWAAQAHTEAPEAPAP